MLSKYNLSARIFCITACNQKIHYLVRIRGKPLHVSLLTQSWTTFSKTNQHDFRWIGRSVGFCGETFAFDKRRSKQTAGREEAAARQREQREMKRERPKPGEQRVGRKGGSDVSYVIEGRFREISLQLLSPAAGVWTPRTGCFCWANSLCWVCVLFFQCGLRGSILLGAVYKHLRGDFSGCLVRFVLLTFFTWCFLFH